MAIFFVSLRQATDSGGTTRYKWSNGFYVDVQSLTDALDTGLTMWSTYLRNAARTDVWCYEIYGRDVNPSTDVFGTASVPQGSQRGTLSPPTGEYYNSAICLAVTIPVPGSRPSRKFWRPGLREGDVNADQVINGSLISSISTAFSSMISNLTGTLVDPDGEALQLPVVIKTSIRRLGDEAKVDLPTPPPQG